MDVKFLDGSVFKNRIQTNFWFSAHTHTPAANHNNIHVDSSMSLSSGQPAGEPLVILDFYLTCRFETTPPYAPRSSRFGSEPPSVEDDVDVWRYAIFRVACQKQRRRCRRYCSFSHTEQILSLSSLAGMPVDNICTVH